MNAAYINPFLASTTGVFETMLGVEVKHEAPFFRRSFVPQYEVTGIIGLSGNKTGTVAVSLPREMAVMVTEKLLGERPTEIDAQVADAVGELTNMIAGAAKAQLPELQLSLGLPTVIAGNDAAIAFPSRTTPLSLPFTSEYGPLTVEVGIA